MTVSQLKPSSWLAPAVAVAAVFAAYLGCIRWWGALASIAVIVWFATFGILVARRVLESRSTRIHWVFGPVWGVTIATIGLLVLWLLGFRAAWILAAAPWPLWILLAVPLPTREWSLPTLDRRDLLALSLLLLIVPIVAGLPYHNVAAPMPDGGKAYRAYFTADFVWAMTTVNEVSKGDIPPVNPFLPGKSLNYYWLAHFLSAAEFRVAAPLGIAVEEVTLANSLGYCVVFILFLYGFARALGGAALSTGIAVAFVFLANSYEAADRIWEWWYRDQLWARLKDINIDAVTRWFYTGMPVDGLHRMFLYQPHHLGGYALSLSALLLVARATDVSRPLVAAGAGLLLGAGILFSSFTAIIIGVAVSIVYGIRLLTARQWRAIPVCVVLGAAPVGAAIWASTALEYVDPAAGSLVTIGPNPVALTSWAYTLLLSFGPMLLLGLAGAAVATVRRTDAWAAGVLAIVALGFYFLTDVADMSHVWVGWRAGHVFFIASTVFVSLLLNAVIADRARRYVFGVVIAFVVLFAVPTVAIDVYNAQDITNRGMGAAFPWTLILTKSETDALDWVKRRTSRTAVVQPDVKVRDNASWGYMTAFGERRMAAGMPIAMIPLQPYIDATDAVGQRIFGGGSAQERWNEAKQRGIEYLYVGPVEQSAHPDLIEVLGSRRDLFLEAFRNDAVVIYRVAGVNAPARD